MGKFFSTPPFFMSKTSLLEKYRSLFLQYSNLRDSYLKAAQACESEPANELLKKQRDSEKTKFDAVFNEYNEIKSELVRRNIQLPISGVSNAAAPAIEYSWSVLNGFLLALGGAAVAVAFVALSGGTATELVVGLFAGASVGLLAYGLFHFFSEESTSSLENNQPKAMGA